MTARFLGLGLAVGEQLVDFLGQRPDLGGKSWPIRVFAPERIERDFAPNAAERPKPVEGLQRGQDQQADAERQEAPDQSRAKRRICSSIVSRDWATWKRQRTFDPGQDHVALGDAQRLGAGVEFVAVVEVGCDVAMPSLTRSRRSQSEREGKVSAPAPLIWK